MSKYRTKFIASRVWARLLLATLRFGLLVYICLTWKWDWSYQATGRLNRAAKDLMQVIDEERCWKEHKSDFRILNLCSRILAYFSFVRLEWCYPYRISRRSRERDWKTHTHNKRKQKKRSNKKWQQTRQITLKINSPTNWFAYRFT